MCLKKYFFFQIGGRSYQWLEYLKLLGRGLQQKSTVLFVLFSVVIKILDKLVSNRLVDLF